MMKRKMMKISASSVMQHVYSNIKVSLTAMQDAASWRL